MCHKLISRDRIPQNTLIQRLYKSSEPYGGSTYMLQLCAVFLCQFFLFLDQQWSERPLLWFCFSFFMQRFLSDKNIIC